jgi:hypothetical protein
VNFVHAVGRAQPEPDAVQAHRPALAHAAQHVQVAATVAEVVLAVDLDPSDRRPGLEEIRIVRGAQPDPRAQADVCLP